MKPTVNAIRFRLAALWLAALARAVGTSSVLAYATMRHSNGHFEPTFGFLFLLLGLFAVPAFALAPLIGALASSRARWTVMIVATLIGLGAIVISTFNEQQSGKVVWLFCIGALAFDMAFHSACRFALLPEAARAGQLSLPRLNGVFLLASAVGGLIGLWIGIGEFPVGKEPGMPIPLQMGHIGYGLALIAILVARLSTHHPLSVQRGLIVPLARTTGAIARDRDGRNTFLVLLGVCFIFLAVALWLLATEARYAFLLALIIGIVIGGWNWHPYRTVGIVPFAMIGLTVCLLWAVTANNWHNPAIGMGCFLGMMVGPLLTWYQIHQPEESRGYGAALLHAGFAILTAGLLFLLMQYLPDPSTAKPLLGYLVLSISLVLLGFSWLVLFRPAFEIFMSIPFWPLYRVKSVGPGVPHLPWKGPVLMVANHAAWFDPIWITHQVTCRTTFMMTSKFYDIPVLAWLMRKVYGAIRVLDATIRKNAPELQDAIKALDRGECVLIFPEGWLRRKEEQEMRRFARGVWEILKARPDTPVIACWIEGGWGSMVSWKNGPPFKGKSKDFWRKIVISFNEPIKLDAATLATHMSTRIHLMKAVLEARSHLGLPPYDPFQLPSSGDDEPEKKENDA